MSIEQLLQILRQSIKDVPALKYAYAVLALVAIVALVSATQIDYRIAGFGALFVVLMAVLVLVFSKLSHIGNEQFRVPALVFLWFSLALASRSPRC